MSCIMNRYLVVILLSGIVTIGLLANDTYFQSIIANMPKNVTARYSYDTYVVNEYGNRICIASYPCNSQLSGYLAKGEVGMFLDGGKLGAEEWLEAILDMINLRKVQFNPTVFWRDLWSSLNVWSAFQNRYNEKKAQKDKKFAKKWQNERQQKIEERHVAKDQRSSE